MLFQKLNTLLASHQRLIRIHLCSSSQLAASLMHDNFLVLAMLMHVLIDCFQLSSPHENEGLNTEQLHLNQALAFCSWEACGKFWN